MKITTSKSSRENEEGSCSYETYNRSEDAQQTPGGSSSPIHRIRSHVQTCCSFIMAYPVLNILGQQVRNGLSHIQSHWRILLFGQLISLALGSSGAISSELFIRCSVNIPTTQFAFMYFLLSFHLVPIIYKFYFPTAQNTDADSNQNRRDNSFLTKVKQILRLEQENQINSPTHLNQLQLQNEFDAEIIESERSEPFEVISSSSFESNSSVGGGGGGVGVISHRRQSPQRKPRVDENTQTFNESSSVVMYKIPFLNIPLHGPLWLYFLMSIMDVEANFFTILAFRYTSLTSVTLLDSLAIPGAMVASKIILKSKYKYSTHILGAIICMTGIVINVYSDWLDEREAKKNGDIMYSHEVLGDFLAAIGGILYGVNDAVAELLVKKFDIQEYLGFTGFFGFFVSIIQAYILEYDDIKSIMSVGKEDLNVDDIAGEGTCQRQTIFWFVVFFVGVNYFSYVSVSRFLVISEAALLNLSLLTGDFYAVLFSIFGEHIMPDPLFYVALFMICLGVLIYESGPSPMIGIEYGNNNKTGRSSSLLNEDGLDGDIELRLETREFT